MTLAEFRALGDSKRYQVVCHGTFLGDRILAGHQVLLYNLGTFYVEVFYSLVKQSNIKLRAFRSTKLLFPYLDQIGISGVERVLYR